MLARHHLHPASGTLALDGHPELLLRCLPSETPAFGCSPCSISFFSGISVRGSPHMSRTVVTPRAQLAPESLHAQCAHGHRSVRVAGPACTVDHGCRVGRSYSSSGD